MQIRSLGLIRRRISIPAVLISIYPSIFTYFFYQSQLSIAMARVSEHLMDKAVNASKSFVISPQFDFLSSTEENYEEKEKCVFVGKYASHRSELDYTYHKCYQPKRQILHDVIVDAFLETIIKDGEVTCNVPMENWMVFTAGAMGVGKGHTIRWLNDEGLFPLDAFVVVDPDILRGLLPETKEYFHRDPYSAGYLTQKEVGYISEVRKNEGLDQ